MWVIIVLVSLVLLVLSFVSSWVWLVVVVLVRILLMFVGLICLFIVIRLLVRILVWVAIVLMRGLWMLLQGCSLQAVKVEASL